MAALPQQGAAPLAPLTRLSLHTHKNSTPAVGVCTICLDPETGFSWIGEYDITADELLSGAGGNTATKTEQAERLILDLLADGKELASEDIDKAAAEAGISPATRPLYALTRTAITTAAISMCISLSIRCG